MLGNYLGNEQLIENFKTLKKGGKLSHAYIFCSNDSVLNGEFVKHFSKIILCRENDLPCGRCEACHKLESGNHPDVLVVNETGSIKVEKIRSLRSEAYIKPNESDRKIIAICDAQNMTIGAQNALLKVLEEPPESTIFLLFCDNTHKLLPTIRSRCIIFTLNPLSENELSHLLKDRFGENIGDDIISAAVKFSEGSLQKAVEIIEDNAKALKLTPVFFERAMDSNLYEFLKLNTELSKDKTVFIKTCDYLIDFCMRVLNNKANIDNENDGNATAAANKLTKSSLFNIIDMIADSRETAEFINVNINTVSLNMLLGIWEEIH